METGKISKPTYQDYLSAGFIPILCRGYHPKYNPKRIYDTAKQPAFKGWDDADYAHPSLENLAAWEKGGGWTGWRIPRGIIALDVEDRDDTARVREICRQHSLHPAIHRTSNGVHFLFKIEKDYPSDTEMFIKCGLKVTYRVGGKNYLILAHTNGRSWEVW